MAASSNEGADAEDSGGPAALASRLVSFRKWLSDDAKLTVHPSLCIVNGEATDGTKQAPVLAFGPPSKAQPVPTPSGNGRVGIVGSLTDQRLYENSIGCQVRVAKDIKKGDTIMEVPRGAFITPDLVASSDAGRALLACCQVPTQDTPQGFWSAFGSTAVNEAKFALKVSRNPGTQLLVKILQERKRAETAFNREFQELNGSDTGAKQARSRFSLAKPGTISTRAPLLAFLIHQRFSEDAHVPVVSESESIKLEFQGLINDDENKNALSVASAMSAPPGSPKSFGPYARTLPTLVSLPICWKRNELALLAGCIPGITPLQLISATTMQLAAEFIALVDAGIMSRFPKTFPLGLITWERWVWAAAVVMSRALPSSCYLDNGEGDHKFHWGGDETKLNSPSDVWNELGVLIPLMDMVNHEVEATQVKWESTVPSGDIVKAELDESGSLQHPRAIVQRKTRKGQQLYCCYGNDKSNQDLILQYGFAQVGNKSDQARLGWGLSDAVGGVRPPPGDESDEFNRFNDPLAVYDSADPAALSQWWDDDRLSLLEQELHPRGSDSFMPMLRKGSKMMGSAFCEGSYDPLLLTAALVGTMPPSAVKQNVLARSNGKHEPLEVTNHHLRILNHYLERVFSKKLEKLLENLNNGLKDHYSALQLWVKASKNGLDYKPGDDDQNGARYTGWRDFFDDHAYAMTMEVEKHYYAVDPSSCVLSLYDGHLQSLHLSIDGMSTPEKFNQSIVKLLRDLGFSIREGTENRTWRESSGPTVKMEVEVNGSHNLQPKDSSSSIPEKNSKLPNGSQCEDDKSNQQKNRRRNKKKIGASLNHPNHPLATKLHIGNLSYLTTPADLYDFFASICGRENVLECHIPTERGTGKSRGFGFVTLLERTAQQILNSGRVCQVDGRVLKVAQSNSAGSARPDRAAVFPPPPHLHDRCANCGYRPRYCVCYMPNMGGQNNSRHGNFRRDFDHPNYRRRRSRSPSPLYHVKRRIDSEGEYEHESSRGRRFRHNDRSDSPDHSHNPQDWDRRGRKRIRGWSHERSRDSSPPRRHKSSSYGKRRERRHYRDSSDYSRSRSRSPSYDRRSQKERKSADSDSSKDYGADRRSSDQSSMKPASESGRSRERRRSRSRGVKRSKKKRHARSRSRSTSLSSTDDQR